VGDNLDLAANFGLEALELPVLAEGGGDLGFVDHPALTHLRAPALTVLKNSLVAKGNAGLLAFDMPKLTRVEGYVTIQNNARLQSLSGLSAVTYVKVKLFVRDNPALPQCSAVALRDQLKPERPMWGEDLGGNADKPCE